MATRTGFRSLVIGAILLTQCQCGVLGISTLWIGDAGAVDASVSVDGRYLRKLKGITRRGSPLVNRGRWSSCIALGDTVAAVGGRYVWERFRLPKGSHSVVVITAAGDTLTGRAEIGDSPDVELWTRCGVLDLPR